MTYQLPSVDSVLKAINDQNSTAFTADDVTFSKPKVVAGTWREGNTDRNTAVRVSGKEGGRYGGSKVVTYDRRDLGALANIPGFQVRATGATSVHQLFEMLGFYTGVKLTADDVEDTSLVQQDGKLQGVISAKPDSLAWIGSVQIEVKPGGVRLSSHVEEDELPGLNYPTANDQDVFAAVYSYGYDFTSHFDALADLEPGVIDAATAQALVDMLKAVDVSSGATLWNASESSTEWSLAGAEILYSGLNGPEHPSNQNYKYVVALELRDGVTVPAGTMYLHYNDPFDPNDF